MFAIISDNVVIVNYSDYPSASVIVRMLHYSLAIHPYIKFTFTYDGLYSVILNCH